MSDALQTGYRAFMQANGTGVRALTDCLIDILAWRYQYRHAYATLPFVQAADKAGQNDLLGAHRIFLKDIGEGDDGDTQPDTAQNGSSTGKLSLGARLFRWNRADPAPAPAAPATTALPKARRDILDQVLERKPGAAELAFFSTYCHDSYAGFKPFDVTMIGPLASRNAPWEDGGYLRYRTRYAGESLRLAMREAYPQDQADAAAA
jgi:hypothetical protein